MPELSELLVPESPMVYSGFPSPDLRRTESSTSRSYPTPRFLSDPSPATLAPLLQQSQAENESSKGKGNDLRTRVILRHALRWAVDRMDLDLMAWLVSLDGVLAELLDDEAQGVEDDDGWGLLGMAIQNSCGRQEQEESVRLLVGRWGINIGPRNGTDRSGWTPLHLAALISTPPLISFLLNRGASPHALTNRGLTPLDLVSGIPDRSDIAVFLEHSSATATPALDQDGGTADSPSLSSRRQAMLRRRRAKAAARLHKQDQDERGWHAEREKEAWVREMAAIVEVSPELLLPEAARDRAKEPRLSHDSGITEDWRDGSDEEDEDSEVEDEVVVQGTSPVDRNDSMLVFSLTSLPALLDILIGSFRTASSPLDKRTLPANALYLHARFALFRCDESWLEELLEGAVERIEQGVYSNVEDLAYLAFWAYNTTTLLHLLRSDPDVSAACEELNLLGMVEELINAIHVFIIRVAERRIDAIFDAALLDYETLEDFDDVRFEGEWTLFRSFGGKKRRELLPKASQIFNTGSPNPGSSIEASPSGLLGALRDNVAAASPLKTLASRASIQDLRGHASRSTSMDSLATVGGGGANGMGPTERLSPVHVTDILSGVLMVLQLYEVNPAITIQAFSQVFFWIACEMFNRILTRKKYLCRSKAVQIRMNITVLEDWVRANGLPTQTGTKYLEPVNQLLRWLQCLSQVRDFDTVIGTMQTLRNLNPLQMRKAVRDYRYEVNEGRMTEECGQYLAQLQKDWEKRRVQLVERQHQRPATDESSIDVEMESSTPIDALFDGTTSLSDFVPQSAPECYGELLDSRFMLPFLLPENVEFLVATPPTDAAFANANISAPFSDTGRMSRAGSRSSFASTRPMGWALPESRRLRRLPRDFFTWLKEKETERRLQRDSRRPQVDLTPAIDPPLGPSARLPARPLLNTHLSSVHEDEDATPISSSVSHPTKLGAGMPSPSPGLRTSDSLNQLREQAKIPFEPVPVHRREDSFELQQRSSASRTDRTDSQISAGPVTPMRVPNSAPIVSSPMSSFSATASPLSPKSAQYELGRLHRNDGPFSPSVSDVSAGGEGAEGPRKRWWKLGRTASSTSSAGSEGDRRRREASEDTVVRA